MKKLQNILILGLVALGFAACNSTPTAQNMPLGGTPFTGVFTPGIGNLGVAGPNSCTNNGPETLTFVVQESATIFQDGLLYPNENIVSGTFTNPVNQNNPCFIGTITYSQCSAADSGTLKFTACVVNLLGSEYQFLAVYYLYSAGGVLISSGTVNATK